MRSFRLMALLLGLFVSLSQVQADTLLIDTVQANAGVDKPVAGMSMSQVQNRYGEPQSRGNAIGEPPISTWQYPNFIVYFEHQHVIHAVVPR